jgi:hypothetical protein
MGQKVGGAWLREQGYRHKFLQLGRVSYDEVGRPVLTIIEDDESVNLREGDEFVTFLTTMQYVGREHEERMRQEPKE